MVDVLIERLEQWVALAGPLSATAAIVTAAITIVALIQTTKAVGHV